MRKIGYIIILLAVCLSVYAAPARRGWMPRVLADGTEVEVQQYGDEYYHFMVTKDGKMVEETVEGLRVTDEPAPTPEQVAARRAQRAPKAVGKPKPINRVLVILVSYADLAIQPKNTAIAIDSLFNYSGYNYNGATGSARDYFIAQSDSLYMPTFDVVGPVTLANNRAHYGENSSGNTDRRAREMIKEACQAVDGIVDFSQYDSDGDGKVDAVYVIYAGIGANDNDGVPEAIWPHQSTVSGLTLDGKQIYTYACSGEIDGVTKDRTGIGPICHEFGHAIGMPDYYSTGSSGAYIVCEWSAMDYGMYNNGANTPPNYSIFDKEYMGWTTVRELNANQQKNVSLTTDYSAGYKMTIGAVTYYVENRQRVGWDLPLRGSGMLVWYVKYDQSVWNNNQVNYTNTSPRYTVLSAKSGLMTNGDNVWSSAADPFPGSQNVTSWTAGTGFVLTDIVESGGTVLFKFNGGKTECSYELMAEHCEVPEDGVLALGGTLILTIMPEAGYVLDPECWAVEMGEENPLLEYGLDYTYDKLTGEFRLEGVTDDVVIIVEAKEDTGTGLESGKWKEESGKIIRNGQLIIIRGEKEYNAQGAEIR